MPRFYFHIHEAEICRDEEGQEFPGEAEAMKAAIAGARELASEDLKNGQLDLHYSISVEDAAGSGLAIITYWEAAGLKGPPPIVANSKVRGVD